MQYRKNDLVDLYIEDMGTDGEGIGKIDGFTVFVKDAVIGDRITAKIIKTKAHYAYGRLEKVLSSSPLRVQEKCPVAKSCGGCQLQALDYREQLRFKERKVRGNLERIGGFTDIPMEPIIGMDHPWRYRNKAQFPVGLDKNGRIIAGFYAGRTHSIIECKDCVLGNPVNSDIIDTVKRHMERYGIAPYDENTGKGLVRHILTRCALKTGQIMICLVLNGNRLPYSDALVSKMREIPGVSGICINVNREKTNVILGSQIITLWGQPYIEDYIGDVKFRISPLSFFQINSVQTEKLYLKALEYAGLSGNENVWDLYCGIGTISLFLAKKARRVQGVEIIEAAVENARENASQNGISNVEFYTGRAEDVLPGQYSITGEHADVIVVDPPRKGCDIKLLDTILEMSPSRIVYISCDSATLSRDLKHLCQNGYHLEKVCPVDQFCQTVHVETIVLLTRNT